MGKKGDREHLGRSQERTLTPDSMGRGTAFMLSMAPWSRAQTTWQLCCKASRRYEQGQA